MVGGTMAALGAVFARCANLGVGLAPAAGLAEVVVVDGAADGGGDAGEIEEEVDR